MTRERATELINTYGRAWVTRDPELILSVFTPDARYYEPHEPQNVGHAEIRAYWERVVVEGQKDITFELKNVWVDGDTVIAHWGAELTDIKRSLRIILDQVALCTISGDRFSAVREYYKSTKTPISE
jgi:uncharacterized protein (TIGR02246 family)